MSESMESIAEQPLTHGEVPTEALLLGAFAGAIFGAAAAYLWAKRQGVEARLDGKRALKAGMLLLGTARQLAALLAEEA